MGWVFALIVGVACGVAVAVVNPGFEAISGEWAFNEFTFGELNGGRCMRMARRGWMV